MVTGTFLRMCRQTVNRRGFAVNMDTVQQPESLEEFFIERLREALSVQKLSISGEVEFYLVHLLTHFAHSQNFFHTTSEGRIEDRPLALRLYDATFDAGKRFIHLKTLGDTALYSAGVFMDGLGEKRGTIDYYISMGSGAYSSLANMTTAGMNCMADLFDELAKSFAPLTETISKVCEKNDDGNIFKLLERWRLTGSVQAKEKLVANGINPDAIELTSKNVQ